MTVTILKGDCRDVLRTLPDESVHCVVTSPPYWGLRDYGVAGQIGLEVTPEGFTNELVAVFRDVRRVLRTDGTLWLNLGDSYAASVKGANGNGEGGSTLTSGARPHIRAAYNDGRGREGHAVDCGLPAKNLVGIPWRVAFALQADGWYLRQDIIWHKTNPMPESVTDRPTKAHEYLFLLAKNGGSALLWRHRDTRAWVYTEPTPDYIWRHRKTKVETREPQSSDDWARINLWASADYYYDQDAILEDASPSTHARLSQDVAAQIGSARANGGAKDQRQYESCYAKV